MYINTVDLLRFVGQAASLTGVPPNVDGRLQALKTEAEYRGTLIAVAVHCNASYHFIH